MFSPKLLILLNLRLTNFVRTDNLSSVGVGLVLFLVDKILDSAQSPIEGQYAAPSALDLMTISITSRIPFAASIGLLTSNNSEIISQRATLKVRCPC